MRHLAFVLLFCAAFALPARGTAQARVPEADVEAETEACSEQELEALSRALTDETARVQRRSRAFLSSWAVVNGAFLIGSVVIGATTDERSVRNASIFSAVGSGVTLACIFAPPISGVFLSRRAASLDDRAETARVRIERRVALLGRAAADEHMQRHPAFHAVNLAYGIGQGLFLGLHHHSLGLALLNGGGTIVVAETQLFSAPRAAQRTLARFEARLHRCGMMRSEVSVHPSPVPMRASLMPTPFGATLAVRFH